MKDTKSQKQKNKLTKNPSKNKSTLLSLATIKSYFLHCYSNSETCQSNSPNYLLFLNVYTHREQYPGESS